jgi:hypothetical protein
LSNNALLEETLYDESMELTYDDLGSYSGSGAAGDGSPIDDSPGSGSPSGDGGEDGLLGLALHNGVGPNNGGIGSGGGVMGGMNVLGKPLGTNNFVTKLYQ